MSEKGEAVVRSALGFIQIADHYLYRGLAAAVALTGTRWQRAQGTAERCGIASLACMSLPPTAPIIFGSTKPCCRPKRHGSEGQFTDALKHYNRAIELAEAEGFTHLVGLANERAALCCLADEQRRLAGWYLSCSRAAYEKWGATAKVAWLDREYATLLPAAASASNGTTPTTARPISHQGESFDIAAALQASRIIASGENTDRVLTHLMQVIRVQPGQRPLSCWRWKAASFASKPALRPTAVMWSCFHPHRPIPASGHSRRRLSIMCCIAVMTSCSSRPIPTRALPNAAMSPSRHPKSVICSGIRHQGELLGVIYLEHTQIAGAFSGQKLEWLRLLSTEVGLMVSSGRLSRYREYVRKFAPSAVSREIDANPASPDLTAKDCDVSILFADLAGFTRMSELMGRRQMTELINLAFSRFVDEIHRYDGVLLEIGGDELFVLFGDEDRSKHVWKAAKAALAISRAAIALKEELSSASPPLMMNMGINSGIASVGLHSVEAASGSRWHYGASGTVVNVAARVRELARDGNIMMSANSVARISDDFLLEDIGEHSLKNVMKPIRIYRLCAERSG